MIVSLVSHLQVTHPTIHHPSPVCCPCLLVLSWYGAGCPVSDVGTVGNLLLKAGSCPLATVTIGTPLPVGGLLGRTQAPLHELDLSNAGASLLPQVRVSPKGDHGLLQILDSMTTPKEWHILHTGLTGVGVEWGGVGLACVAKVPYVLLDALAQ